MKKNMQGFTLIELMIVVAIIAILAAIAISQYQDYVIRTQVSEGASLAGGMKTAVTEFRNNYGRWASSHQSYGLAAPTSITGKYVLSASAVALPGKIQITYGKDKHANLTGFLVYSAIPHEGSMEWSCDTAAGTTVPAKYRPTVCRD